MHVMSQQCTNLPQCVIITLWVIKTDVQGNDLNPRYKVRNILLVPTAIIFISNIFKAYYFHISKIYITGP